jgi:hypothetical protein
MARTARKTSTIAAKPSLTNYPWTEGSSTREVEAFGHDGRHATPMGVHLRTPGTFPHTVLITVTPGPGSDTGTFDVPIERLGLFVTTLQKAIAIGDATGAFDMPSEETA